MRPVRGPGGRGTGRSRPAAARGSVGRCGRGNPDGAAPEDPDELLLVAHFPRRPPPKYLVRPVRAGGGSRRVTGRYPCADGAEAPDRGDRDLRRPSRRGRRAGGRRSSVGLDPRVELLPVELRGDPDTAGAFSRFCCGLVDAVAPSVVAVKPQLAFFEALGAEALGMERRLPPRRCPAIADGKRLRHRLDRAGVRDRLPRIGNRRRADREPVSRLRLARAVPRGRRTGAGIFCLVKTSNAGGADVQDLILSDGRPCGTRWRRSCGGGARSSSASTGSRTSARSSGRPIRGRRRGQAADAAVRSSCSRAWERRARPRRTSRGPSRAGPRARSWPRRDRSCTQGGTRRRRLAPCRGRGRSGSRARSGPSRGGDRPPARGAAGRAGRVPPRVHHPRPPRPLGDLRGRAGDGAASRDDAGAGDDQAPATTAAPAATAPATTAAASTYTIESGDTLQTIADQYGTTVEELLVLNPGVDPTALQVGQAIRVP